MLTVAAIRALSDTLHIPADLLIRERAPAPYVRARAMRGRRVEQLRELKPPRFSS